MARRTRGRYRAKKEQSRSRLYFLLALVMVFFMIKWGLPLTIRLIAKTSTSTSEETAETDNIPPQKPVLSSLPEATNSSRLKIEGYTEANASVSYWVNGENTLTEESASDGFFDSWIVLEEDLNEVYVRAKDKDENESSSQIYLITYDHEDPQIELETPKDGEEFFGSQSETITVKGKVSEKANLQINGFYVILDSENNFEHKLKLNEGENEIIVEAMDKAGNKQEKKIKVNYVR